MKKSDFEEIQPIPLNMQHGNLQAVSQQGLATALAAAGWVRGADLDDWGQKPSPGEAWRDISQKSYTFEKS